jgi:hypothetical protein
METALDEIAAGKQNGRDYLRDFWTQVSPLFGQQVITATLAQTSRASASATEDGESPARKRTRRVSSRKPPTKTKTPVQTAVSGQYGVCPQCGKVLVKRKGPRGEFLGCGGFPKCRFTRPLPEQK